MASSLVECPVATCLTGPCRMTAPLILADAAEVPIGCPNRIELADIATQLPRLLSATDLHTTPRAAELISIRPNGGQRSDFRLLIAGGKLALLEQRVLQPIRGGGGTRRAPEEPEAPDAPDVVDEQDWIEIALKKRDGSPAVGESYEIHLTDGTTQRGEFDESGKVRFDNIPAGTCVVGFPALDQNPNAGGGGDAAATGE